MGEARTGGMSEGSGIDWREWSAAAFDEARAADRPVLLSGYASWCADSRNLRDRVLSHPDVAAVVSEEFVPVRFDADRLPHVRDRYNAAGWPVTALLTPDGDLLWAGPTPTPDHFRSFVRQAAQAWRDRRSELEFEIRRRALASDATRGRVTGGGLVRREAADDVLTAAQAAFDERNGGFGESFKPVQPDIIELLLVQGHNADNPDWIQMATRTLDGMLAGDIMDRRNGGFFRLARKPDWTDPATEKLLESNAWALRAFGVGAHLLGRADLVDAVEGTVAWADDTLALPDGLWGGSQAADDSFHAGGHADEGPPVDRTVYTDAAAQWISALAEVGGRLGRDDWVRRAARGLDALLDTMSADDGLLYHFRPEGGEPAVAGLLSDVVETARACLVLAQATGDWARLTRATELANAMRAHFWAEDGGFNDIAPRIAPVAALSRAVRPFETNATAASVLVDLSMLENGRSWRALAERALAVLTPLAGRYGIGGAGFALAVEHYFEPPRFFAVVGDGVAAERLRNAALAVPVVDRQVWSLPGGGVVAGRRFQVATPAVVYACTSRRCSAPIASPEELSVASPPQG